MTPARSALALLLGSAACSGGFSGSPGGPSSTSLGELVRVEKQHEVRLKGESRPALAAGRGQILYLLRFEGQSQIHFESARPDYPLIEDSGEEFPPVYAGSPTAEGALTGEGWVFASGGRMSMGGRWAYGGDVRLPEPKVVLVYLLPEDVRGLSLRDGKKEIPVPRPAN